MGQVSAWMPLYIGDYLADTMHLNAQEHGAYLLLIMHYWRTGPLPDSDDFLAKISRVTPLEWKRKVRSAVLPFFILENGRLRHKRVDQEMAVALANKEQRKAAGKASAAARANQRLFNERSTSVATVEPTDVGFPLQREGNPSPSPKDTLLRRGENSPSDPKAELWKDGLSTLMRLTGKPIGPSRKLLGKMSGDAKGDHGRLLALIREAEIQQPDQPEAWLVASIKTWHGKNGHTTFPSLFDAGPWGLQAWADAQPDAIRDRVDGEVATCVGGYGVVAVGKLIAEAANLPEGWRGSWDELGAWLRDGIDSPTILGAIKKSAQWEGYRPPATIRYFDKPVREAGARLRDFR